MRIKMADRKKHVLSKVVKNIIFSKQNITGNVLQTFWYQFCNLNIFWKQKIVKTFWPVCVKSSALAFV